MITVGLFGLGMWKLLACLLLPIAVLKQVVNVIQLKYAASQLAAIDGSDRDKRSTCLHSCLYVFSLNEFFYTFCSQ